ncbi:ADP-ribosylglycohydrolase family protein [Candidatus Uhrbacteria bacterium]|nr:ADP-ribosylglycohydrolase family protein [Candidatus Uhrbacteria bacterium]
MNQKHRRFQGSLMGVRIGDTLGMPWESMSHESILEATGPLGITTFWNPQQRNDAPPWTQGLKSLNPGDYTDDWQMTRAGVKSYIHCSGFDLHHLALSYLEEMELSRLGWGGTTLAGMERVKNWMSEGHSNLPVSLLSHQLDTGSGNGVVMRIAPMALMNYRLYLEKRHRFSGIPTPLQHVIWEVGGLTHPDPRATIGAFAVASLIAKIVSFDNVVTDQKTLLCLLDGTLQEVLFMEENKCRTFFSQIQAERFSSRLAQISQAIISGISADEVRTQFGTSSVTLESAAFSIATFLRHPTDFKAALKEAVEAGGDTDTNAAIVGSLVGANVGLHGIPKEWAAFREDFAEAERLGVSLWTTCQRIHQPHRR